MGEKEGRGREGDEGREGGGEGGPAGCCGGGVLLVCSWPWLWGCVGGSGSCTDCVIRCVCMLEVLLPRLRVWRVRERRHSEVMVPSPVVGRGERWWGGWPGGGAVGSVWQGSVRVGLGTAILLRLVWSVSVGGVCVAVCVRGSQWEVWLAWTTAGPA